MFDPNSTKQAICKIPTFDWPQIDGKTLTMHVDVSGECDSNIEHTTVVGVDAEGRSYVLISTQRAV
ncbi:MAG: hypothetical protein A2139_07800 [Desulfobacca sp. RBG_16_60_12]|nr:MAG: hypothetical protein A2139_07800 [Desulfobacca sp. RBG_16_60_12]